MFPPRLRRGTRHPDAPLPPCFVAESVRADTLRAHPENAAAPAQLYRQACQPQRGKAVSSEVTSGCPKRSEGGCPVGTRTITVFPSGTVLSHAETKLHVSPRVVRPGGFPYSRFRRQSLPRCRSPPQPSAHEYAAPYPAPSPPGTRPHGESPWRSRRDPHRRTAP